MALAAIAFFFVHTLGVLVTAVQVRRGAFVHHLLAYSAGSVGALVHEALVALAVVALFEIDATGILMTIVEMRELALIHQRLATSSGSSGVVSDVLEAVSAGAGVAHGLIDAFR